MKCSPSGSICWEKFESRGTLSGWSLLGESGSQWSGFLKTRPWRLVWCRVGRLYHTPHYHELYLASLAMMDCSLLTVKWIHLTDASDRYSVTPAGEHALLLLWKNSTMAPCLHVPASLKGSIPYHSFWLLVTKFLEIVRAQWTLLASRLRGLGWNTGWGLWVRTAVVVTTAAFLGTTSRGKGQYLQAFNRGFCFHVSQSKTPVSNDRRQISALLESFLKWFHGKKKVIWVQAIPL